MFINAFLYYRSRKNPTPPLQYMGKKIQAPPMFVTKMIPLTWRAIKFLAPDVSSHEASLTIDMGNSIISVYTVYAYLENCS